MHPTRMRILRELEAGRGYPPTMRDLSVLVGVPFGSLHYHLRVLRRDGLITWDARLSRTLQITEAGRAALNGAETP